ncbi:MAG: hypothetical protein PHF00_11110 [Elusimicrobia bacterium]|nr:hypothetical protein [Elusimicrobiota bacterium]
MTPSLLDVVRFLAWCSIVNLGILCLWFLAFLLGRSRLYRMHCRWFPMSEERFNSIHYLGMAVYKLMILVFNLVPLTVLWLGFR